MRRKQLVVPVLLVLSLMGLASNCKKKPPVVPTPPPVETSKEPPPPPPPKTEVEDFKPQPVEIREMSADELNQQGVLKTVYFGYDQSDLDDEDRGILQSNADWLKSNPRRRIVIEGHCDERGTLKYNLALGERRADAAREYLVSLGVDPSRVRIVTYGEERPVDPGHGENSWAKNRRGESRVEP